MPVLHNKKLSPIASWHMQGEIVDQLREVVKAREAAIAQLSNEQVQAGLMFEAVRLERDRLQHEVLNSCGSICDAVYIHCCSARQQQ